MDEKRRLSFGGVAELYDRSRPSYPAPLVDDVVEFARAASGDRVLEVGAGTGKATVLFAQRGLSVVGLEPSAEMAAVARRNCAAYENVTIVRAEFERWRPDGHPFRLLFSAQAWHWIAPDVRYHAARAVLEPGGALALFWNAPDWACTELRDELAHVYRRNGRADVTDDPMNPCAPLGDEDWPQEIAATEGFGGPQVRNYRWKVSYTTAEYLDLLGTHSPIVILDEPRRRRLLADVAGVIDAHAGTVDLSYVTRLCLARAT
ncbi:MAG TPA: class I SAM-dependent methyltransferase [Solirubrobacteraceae bacterium]|nr:class I SAM-dependent methyltransferase [Solirubrobacteraceae bacterium]